MTVDDPMLDTPGAAEYVHATTRWLELSRHRGDGRPFVRLAPQMIRYRKSDLDAWIRERTRRSTAEYATAVEA